MQEINRNNLDRSNSPYLRQHLSNPIWWQEWSVQVIEESVRQRKSLFVSVGYATCHWCHVMASEAFSDKETAEYLNQNFICIKVDREQRPDIDQYLMKYLTSLTGSGGWPLNVFLSPDLKPIFALTYAPAEAGRGMHSFLTIIKKVHEYSEKHPEGIQAFDAPEEIPPFAEEESLVKDLFSLFDADHGGFGKGQKFPPHSTLLYLLYLLCVEENAEARDICLKTLEAMRLGGLHDHLQGGIFRYCVDRKWTIPHFEKMLYDQAMALWCYSLAYRVFAKNEYRAMAEGILRCLQDSFEEDGLFISGHDADTKHIEGATYVWSFDDLKNSLTADELKRFIESYHITENGNFDGFNHLIRKNDAALREIEDKLLSIRTKRAQPEKDNKILCGLNALTAISMIQAGRLLNRPELEEMASRLIRRILALFWNGNKLWHSYYNGIVQKDNFLFDAAAIVTAISMLYENDPLWETLMITMSDYAESFRDEGNWLESRCPDFKPVYAALFDHPIPSSISLAEMGLIRTAVLTQKEIKPERYREPFRADFFNIGVMIRNGFFHLITSKNKIGWSGLSPNTLQIRGEEEADCYRGQCSEFKAGSGMTVKI